MRGGILLQKLKINYNETQEKAIKGALNNNITIIKRSLYLSQLKELLTKRNKAF